MPREYAINRAPYFDYGPVYEDVLEVCLQYVDSLNKTEVNKYGSESKTVVKMVMARQLFKNGWDNSISFFYPSGRFAEYGSNYVLNMTVSTEFGIVGAWPDRSTDSYVCIVSPNLEFIDLEYFEW